MKRSSVPLSLVSETYSDSDSDGGGGHALEDKEQSMGDTTERTPLKRSLMEMDLTESRTNSPNNSLFQTIESLDTRRQSLDDNKYDDEEEVADREGGDERADSPVSFHRSLFGKSDDQIVIPSEPSDLCSKALQEKVCKLHSKMKMGSNMNKLIQRRKDFRNPSIYDKLIAFCSIDEMATNYPPNIYDPHVFTEKSFYEELAKRQKEDMERRERDRRDRTKVEFMSGTKKGQTFDANEATKKKSKWDLPSAGTAANSQLPNAPIGLIRPQVVIPVSVATGTKPTIISAFGTISKKSK